MRQSHPRSWRAASRTTVLLALAAVTLGACDDTTTAPEPRTAAAMLDGDARPRFQPNSTPYRNSSIRPATGRAGSATLSAYVAPDEVGRAVLHVAAGTTGRGTPRLGLVQIKVFDPDGQLLYTRNEMHGPGTRSATYDLGALGRDALVRVHGTVIDADPGRVGVVTVAAPFASPPDLAVASLAAPQRVALSTMVGIAATVRELNGDVGARADCALLVNGVEVDRAWRIWVDAGSAVTCAFRYRFEELGPTDVEVRLMDIEPRDADDSNHSARATVDVQLIPSAFAYDAFFEDATFEETSRSEGYWRSADGAYGYEWNDQFEQSGREQFAYLWGWAPHGLSFPLDEVVFQQMTRDEVAHHARLLDVEPDWTYSDEWGTESCLSRWYETSNGSNSFDLCAVAWTDGEAFTYLNYSRYAGDVTYHSRADYRWWNHEDGYEDTWSWNDTWTGSVGRMVSYGREYGFFVSITDASGVYRMQPLVWLQPFSEDYGYPWSCWDYEDEWGASGSCNEWSRRASGMREFVSGWPTY